MRQTLEPFPWEAVMSFGLGVLKLAPAQFWKSTPREIASAMRAFQNAMPQPPSRKDLDSLLTQFPDLNAASKGQ